MIVSTNVDGSIRGIVLVQDLSLSSFLPLMIARLKFGLISVQYLRATPVGLRMVHWMRRLGIIRGNPDIILDSFLFDTLPYGQFWNIHFQVNKACQAVGRQIDDIIKNSKAFSNRSCLFRAYCTTNIIKEWSGVLVELEQIRHLGWYLADQSKKPPKIVVVSKYSVLAHKLNVQSNAKLIDTIQQCNLMNLALFTPLIIIWSLRRVLISSLGKKSTESPKLSKVSVQGAWGLNDGQKNDLYWWKVSGIPASKLVYVFDRPDTQATTESVEKLKTIGITGVVLDRVSIGNSPHLFVETREPLRKGLSDIWLICKMALRGAFCRGMFRYILYMACTHYARLVQITEQYRRLGICAAFHYQESGPDFVGWGIDAIGGARIGAQWSAFQGPNNSSIRTHHAFFTWGWHDARICIDSGSISQHILISGCPVNEIRSNASHGHAAKILIEEMQYNGAEYFLALFDTSPPVLHFYTFFLQWLLEDSTLGILIKSKGRDLSQLKTEGRLGGLAERGMATGRIRALDPNGSTKDAAVVCNFSVGVGSPSAVVTAALGGARVLYLNYQNQDEVNLKAYSTLYQLGSNRCVFGNPTSLRKSVEEYMASPKSNPELGNITPVLDLFDPFRDGESSARIGEYVKWYLDGIDSGSCRDRALKQATRNYADKWGEDKVVRGI